MAVLTGILMGVLLVLVVAGVVRVITAYVNEVGYPGLLAGVGVSTTVPGLDSGFRRSSRTLPAQSRGRSVPQHTTWVPIGLPVTDG
jgi:hypothetical protein